jgi:hypothetical protein
LPVRLGMRNFSGPERKQNLTQRRKEKTGTESAHLTTTAPTRLKDDGRRCVAFRVIARTRVDAGESLQVWRLDRCDALGWDEILHAGIERTIAPATPKGSRGRSRLFNVWAIDRLRVYWRHISNAAPLRGWWSTRVNLGDGTSWRDRVLAIRGLRRPVQTRMSVYQFRRCRPVHGARGRAPSLD